MLLKEGPGKILEAGCGAGRLLRHYTEKGWDIKGFDYIKSAISKLTTTYPQIRAEFGDIRNLKYADESFKYILAFGLYHNLEDGLSSAISETYRVLQKNGLVCASFRADNIQTKLVDWLQSRKNLEDTRAKKEFHKMNLTAKEFCGLFEAVNMKIEFIFPVVNMPILYKFKYFRAQSHSIFNENKARSEGYLLSPLGKCLQKILMAIAPNQFCNLYVLIARK
jgi:SAM-dependent methyltransferase